jgi:hypothetical protein
MAEMRNGAPPWYLRCLFEDGVTSAPPDGQLLEQVRAYRFQISPVLYRNYSSARHRLHWRTRARGVTFDHRCRTRPGCLEEPPSPLAARCFVDEFKSSKTPTLRLDGCFWEPVGPLLPPESGDKK